MSRRRRAVKRPLVDDARFHSALVTRLVNTVMWGGKKTTAERIVYGAFNSIVEKNPSSNPLEILQRAVDNVKPSLEGKARRERGATIHASFGGTNATQSSQIKQLIGEFRSARLGTTIKESFTRFSQ